MAAQIVDRWRRAAAIGTAVLVLALPACGPRDPQPTPEPSTSTDEPPTRYDERWRPQVHYSPAAGRMADPNGLVWFEGEWHLFHQQDGTWAHAVSTDLMHWQPLATALEHDENGQSLSGSVVVDGANTSGLFGDDGGLVAVYTSTADGEAQSIAYSSDRGRTWQRYGGNPVLPNNGRVDFRDPKVFWHEPTRSWVMVVSVGDAVELYRSPNLLDWSFLSRFGDGEGLHSAVWECPDLFPLPLDGDPADARWVLTVSVGASEETNGSTAQYFIGDFDGTTFVRDAATAPDMVQTTDAGQDFYAAQTFEHAPDGRRIWMGWMGNWQYPYAAPTSPWTNAMSIPRELALRTLEGRLVLTQQMVAELSDLRVDAWTPDVSSLDGTVELSAPDGLTRGAYEVEMEVDLGDARTIALVVHRAGPGTGTSIQVGDDEVVLDRSGSSPAQLEDPSTGELVPFPPRRTSPYTGGDVVRLHVLVDASSVEVVIDGGAVVATMVDYPSPAATGVAVVAEGGRAHVRSIIVHRLASIWHGRQ